jgi:hypothetical protein
MLAIYTKKKLFEKYNYLPEDEMRVVLNEIIAKNRNLAFDIAKYKKILRPTEVRLFLEAYDLV